MQSKSKNIDWKYFFGGSSSLKIFDRYYKAEIDGQRVEKYCSNKGTVYAIGNIDKANKKYKTESDLLTAVSLQFKQQTV